MGRLNGEMEETPAQWVKRRMQEKGLRQVDLANAIGANNPNKISKAFSGERQFKVHEMDILRSLLAEDPPSEVVGSAVREVPVIGSVSAGSWREAIQRPMGSIYMKSSETPPNAVALDVDGDSMNLVIKDAQTVVFDPDDKSLFPDKYYVIMNVDGDTTFKQFKVDPARLVPCSSNPLHKEIMIGQGDFEIVGRVIAYYGRL